MLGWQQAPSGVKLGRHIPVGHAILHVQAWGEGVGRGRRQATYADIINRYVFSPPALEAGRRRCVTPSHRGMCNWRGRGRAIGGGRGRAGTGRGTGAVRHRQGREGAAIEPRLADISCAASSWAHLGLCGAASRSRCVRSTSRPQLSWLLDRSTDAIGPPAQPTWATGPSSAGPHMREGRTRMTRRTSRIRRGRGGEQCVGGGKRHERGGRQVGGRTAAGWG